MVEFLLLDLMNPQPLINNKLPRSRAEIHQETKITLTINTFKDVIPAVLKPESSSL
jgi:hypothetical protein